MAELNLKQITDKLNEQLQGEIRQIVFWYDDNGAFAEDVDSLTLNNAKILHLEKDNQFYIKYFLECVDTKTHYLVYAPFPKPDIRHNHLEDTLRYSQRFFVDRPSVIVQDLGYDEKLKPVFQQYSKFFDSKERTQKFYDLEIHAKEKSDIETGIMSVLCKLKVSGFEEVLRVILINGFKENEYIEKFEQYGVLTAFWEQANRNFGYNDTFPSLDKFVFTMFVTYLSKTIYGEIPPAWQPFLAYKFSNNVSVFLDNLMNSTVYGKRFDRLSADVYFGISGDKILRKMQTDEIIDCYLFLGVDEIIIDWLIDRLEHEDIGVKISGKTIPEICENRKRKHFGNQLSHEYNLIESAWYLLSRPPYEEISGIRNIVKKYTETYFETDWHYRYFYYHYDNVVNNEKFENLRQLIENVYTNDYLNKICVNWNREFLAENGETHIQKQTHFFDKHLRYAKERTVVIISDAFRYEVGYSLYRRLSADEKCKVTIEPMQSVLPSYTRLGMGALLPHSTIELNDHSEVLIDGKTCNDRERRQAILQYYKPESRCIQYDTLKHMNTAQLREVFTGQELVYIYHNQIDARGDHSLTENEVFQACEETVEEIFTLIKRLTSSANTVHFIVTADHGFLYKRDTVSENDKINTVSGVKVFRRFAVSKQKFQADGVANLPLATVLENQDDKIISFPMGSDVFKVSGGGMNFVHGGSSPQEMLIPLIDVRTQRGHKDTTNATIDLISINNKITNLIFSMEFLQREPVSSTVKETLYRIVFVNENGEKVSNEIFHMADNQSPHGIDRKSRFTFRLKNRPYHLTEKYYLLIIDDKKNIEVFRKEMRIDIAFADDFGF